MKTDQCGISVTNKHIFSLNNTAKNFVQLFMCFLLFFVCSNVNAASTSSSKLAPDVENYKKLSIGPNDLVSASLSWTRQGGASGGYAYGRGISSDSNGNSYVTGYTSVGLFGQPQNGTEDYFIVKYDANGNLTWSRQVGASGGQTDGYGISADNSGNIYVTGSTTKGISGQKQNGRNDYFIAKYDANGNLIWTRQVGAMYRKIFGGYTEGLGISADNSGNIYVTGYTTAGISGQKQNGETDYFVAKYDATGNLIWSKQVGASGGATYGYGISADNSGNTYVTGYTTAGISGQKQNGAFDYFIAKYDQTGNLIWTKQAGNAGEYTMGTGVSADSFGNVYVSCFTMIQSGGFIAKYDSLGNIIWNVGSAGGQGISTDNLGNIYITGSTYVGEGSGYFIAQYNQYGNLLWSTKVGSDGAGSTAGRGISVDNSRNIYVTGETDVGLSGQIQNGSKDYFIAKYIN